MAGEFGETTKTLSILIMSFVVSLFMSSIKLILLYKQEEYIMKFSNLNRTEFVNKFKTEVFDVLVIGGGITGAGIALDAQTRGLNTDRKSVV